MAVGGGRTKITPSSKNKGMLAYKWHGRNSMGPRRGGSQPHIISKLRPLSQERKQGAETDNVAKDERWEDPPLSSGCLQPLNIRPRTQMPVHSLLVLIHSAQCTAATWDSQMGHSLVLSLTSPVTHLGQVGLSSVCPSLLICKTGVSNSTQRVVESIKVSFY